MIYTDALCVMLMVGLVSSVSAAAITVDSGQPPSSVSATMNTGGPGGTLPWHQQWRESEEMRSSLVVNQMALLQMMGQMTLLTGPAGGGGGSGCGGGCMPSWAEDLEGRLGSVLTEMAKNQSTLLEVVSGQAAELSQVKLMASELQQRQADLSTSLQQQLTKIQDSLQQEEANSTALLEQQLTKVQASLEHLVNLTISEPGIKVVEEFIYAPRQQKLIGPTDTTQELTTGTTTTTTTTLQEVTTTRPCVPSGPLSGSKMAALLVIGSRVSRGVDWKWGNQDGGPGSMGTITEFREDNWIRVKWDSAGSNVYRMGMSDMYDLKLVVDSSTPMCEEEEEEEGM